jgi:hypothetical protein
MREAMRKIQDLRKEAGVEFNAQVKVQLKTWPKQFEDEIKRKGLISELTQGDEDKLLS